MKSWKHGISVQLVIQRGFRVNFYDFDSSSNGTRDSTHEDDDDEEEKCVSTSRSAKLKHPFRYPDWLLQ